MKVTVETDAWRVSGFLAFSLHLVWIGLTALLIRAIALEGPSFLSIIALVVFGLLALVWLGGYFTVQPNQAKALVFFGRYIGSVHRDGFWWSNPFAVKQAVSFRVRNFNSERLKVNDASGNPIEIAAVVVWKVTDSARALFDVDDYEEFVAIQAETALRGLASQYPYDIHDGAELSLRGNPVEVSTSLKTEVEDRLGVAGVEVIETRLSHLAYSPEIAQAMLRRQQAQAIIAARQQIVEGAVGMVQMALKHLSEKQIVELDEERKATMVNNLLVVLTSEQESQPVLNAGSLY